MSTPGEILTSQFKNDKKALEEQLCKELEDMRTKHMAETFARAGQFSALIGAFDALLVESVKDSPELNEAQAKMFSVYRKSEVKRLTNFGAETSSVKDKFNRAMVELEDRYIQNITPYLQDQVDEDSD